MELFATPYGGSPFGLGPVEQLFADLMAGFPTASLLLDRPAAAAAARGENSHLIKADIIETPAAYILHADAPGCRKADVRVDVDDSRPQVPPLPLARPRVPHALRST